MSEFELRVDLKHQTWNIRVCGNKSYYGVGNPYQDKFFTALLDALCDKENVISLHSKFQKYGFTIRPYMYLDRSDSYTTIESSLDKVGQVISKLLQELIDEYC